MFARPTVKFLLVSVLALSACEMYSESHVTQNRIQIEEEKFTQEIAAYDIDAARVREMAQRYEAHAQGPMELAVVYDPTSGSNTAMKASNEVSRISKILRAEGVKDIKGGVLPVAGHGSEPVVLVSYQSFNALPPRDCKTMQGMESSSLEPDFDYELGCTVDTLFAKQIARPKDLAGQEPSYVTDGRRTDAKVSGYRRGADNKPLAGEGASGE
jgi:type IV pilus biogenesis protein CpaD/CtpE